MFVGATVCTVLHPGWILTSWPALSSTGLRGSCHAWCNITDMNILKKRQARKPNVPCNFTTMRLITGHECIQIPAHWSDNKLPKL